jgi:hypothetical protein
MKLVCRRGTLVPLAVVQSFAGKAEEERQCGALSDDDNAASGRLGRRQRCRTFPDDTLNGTIE